MLALRARAVAIPRAHSSSRIVLAARIRYYSIVANAPRPRKTKVWDSVDEAIKDVKTGDIILSGGTSIHFCCGTLALTYASPVGFGLCGIPETLISALTKRSDVRNLTAVSNNAGAGDHGLGERFRWLSGRCFDYAERPLSQTNQDETARQGHDLLPRRVCTSAGLYPLLPA